MAPGSWVVFATASGGTTMDRDAAGGNPFATALIGLIDEPEVELRQLPTRLRARTIEHSHGHQVPDWPHGRPSGRWRWTRADGVAESRIALVLVVSDYSAAGQPPLHGAAFDERRVSGALASAGFTVTSGIAPDRDALRAALTDFGERSLEHDVAVLYSTGHGIEADDEVYLLPGDFPFRRGYGADALRTSAVPVSTMAADARARTLNLVFFAGCRTLASQPPA